VDIKKKGEDITFAFIEYGNPKDAQKAIDAYTHIALPS
jgi:RNA recognition motif-containing protein